MKNYNFIMLIPLIYIVALFVYITRTIFFLVGAAKEKNRKIPHLDLTEKPFVSVIIPARNEENNIEHCIDSLIKNSYPADKFEIIAVDDRSVDATAEILALLSLAHKNLKVVTISDKTLNKNLRGKPGALQAGINVSSGELILLTDADCTVSPDWIETMVSVYSDDEVGLVASFTNIRGNKLFDKVQAVEWIYMHTMASSGFGLKILLGCFGNNLSVRKTDLDKVGGYDNIEFSVTEDLALLREIRGLGKKARYICSTKTLATTNACKTMKEYLQQKKRWSVGGLDLGWNAVIFVLSSVTMWLGLIVSLVLGDYSVFAAILGIRIFSDYLLTVISVRKLELTKLKRWVLPSIFFFMIMELVAPFLVINKTIVWKDQVFERK
ncbi:MAG: glycosyltransferase [Candidatus Kapabacteria bacterium]|nr:glycosyltransferase [Candidatus Kapabacteria bacterium]